MQQARRLGHIREGAVAVVAVQDVLRPGGDKEIVETVVITVADSHAACPALTYQARFRGRVREGPVTVVLVKPIARSLDRPFSARP